MGQREFDLLLQDERNSNRLEQVRMGSIGELQQSHGVLTQARNQRLLWQSRESRDIASTP